MRMYRRGHKDRDARLDQALLPVLRRRAELGPKWIGAPERCERLGLHPVPVSAATSSRAIWCMNCPSGCGVEPTILTRRDASSMTNSV